MTWFHLPMQWFQSSFQFLKTSDVIEVVLSHSSVYHHTISWLCFHIYFYIPSFKVLRASCFINYVLSLSSAFSKSVKANAKAIRYRHAHCSQNDLWWTTSGSEIFFTCRTENYGEVEMIRFKRIWLCDLNKLCKTLLFL